MQYALALLCQDTRSRKCRCLHLTRVQSANYHAIIHAVRRRVTVTPRHPNHVNCFERKLRNWRPVRCRRFATVGRTSVPGSERGKNEALAPNDILMALRYTVAAHWKRDYVLRAGAKYTMIACETETKLLSDGVWLITSYNAFMTLT